MKPVLSTFFERASCAGRNKGKREMVEENEEGRKYKKGKDKPPKAIYCD